MKQKLTSMILAFLSGAAVLSAHEGVERGPNGGRILEFSKDETMHGEVTVKEGKFHIALLDKDMKPVAVAAQTLTASTGDRAKPVKLEVAKAATGFSLPVVSEGAWLILQFRNGPEGKPITARMEYNTATCDGCKEPEWLCKCEPEKEKEKEKPAAKAKADKP
jgi:hypothetical protein